jgi:alpha-1,2-mannosyltransferase
LYYFSTQIQFLEILLFILYWELTKGSLKENHQRKREEAAEVSSRKSETRQQTRISTFRIFNIAFIMMYNSSGSNNVMLIISTTTFATMISILLYVIFRLRPKSQSYSNENDKSRSRPKVIAFFHPYASGGGGGERVLWKMIQYLQQKSTTDEKNKTRLKIVIYTIDPPTTKEEDLRHDAEKRFDVTIPQPVHLVSLTEYSDYLKPSPYLSLVLESIGTMKLVQRALLKLQPDIFCDTTGCAFTFAVVRWMCPQTSIVAYVHYPTISTDMMLWEWKKNTLDNDDESTRKNSNVSLLLRRFKTTIKLIYYWFFAILYGLVGSLADLVMVNSTWTYDHISSLWRLCRNPIHIVYPPCRVPTEIVNNNEKDNKRNSTSSQRKPTIVSIGQFRPEKDHQLQIRALSKLLENHPELRTGTKESVKLLLIGSCRNEADQGRVDELRRLVKQLELAEYVEFDINPPYHELQAAMTDASIGIHTMRQEHFGIGIVEMMAAGLLVVAHNSGGPQTDIVNPGETGFLATTADEYSQAIFDALTMDKVAEASMRRKAQQSATRFSDEAFDERLEKALTNLNIP